MANYTTLSALFAATASAIRTKTGSTASIKADDFPSAISAISTGAAPTGTTTLTSQGQTYNVAAYASAKVSVPQATAGTYAAGTTSVAIAALANKYVNGTPYIAPITASNLTAANIVSGTTIKIYSGSTQIMSITGSAIKPAGTINITSNGTHDVSAYASASVNVAGGTSFDVTLSAALPSKQYQDNGGNTQNYYYYSVDVADYGFTENNINSIQVYQGSLYWSVYNKNDSNYVLSATNAEIKGHALLGVQKNGTTFYMPVNNGAVPSGTTLKITLS